MGVKNDGDESHGKKVKTCKKPALKKTRVPTLWAKFLDDDLLPPRSNPNFPGAKSLEDGFLDLLP